jgi:uncharacterized protein YcaQ
MSAAQVSLAAARRIALAAQGFARERPPRIDRRQVGRTVDALGLLQIDSVNVLARAHYLPLFSRLGPYEPALLERAAWGRRSERRLFEYWGHEASLLPLELQPLLRWRMERARRGEGIYRRIALFARERPDFIDRVLREIAERGPLGASGVGEGGRGKSAWWGWSEGKLALEYLFWSGAVTTATRRNFERIYDLPERVFPAAVTARATPSEPEAIRRLLLIAARALGIGTAGDLRDYFRLDPADAYPRLAELVAEGALVPVAVEGWKQPAYLDPEAHRPRRVAARALVSPFDPLVWERARTERLFGFRYRIEIYTPVHKREHGYYVLPFLLGERLVARVDLKADRPERALHVRAAHAEPGIDQAEVAGALAAELASMASWLGLERLRLDRRGDLSAALRRSL